MSVAARTLPLQNVHELLPLLTQICETYKAVLLSQLEFSRLHESMLQFEELVFSFANGEEHFTGLIESLTPELIGRVNEANSFWESTFERQFALDFLEDRASLSDYFRYTRLEEMVRRELSLVPDLWPQRILFIGDGALALNVLQIHFQTGLPVDCAYSDQESMAVARRVLQKCNLDNSVRTFCLDDREHDFSSYDLVFVAADAHPKKKILRHLRKKCHRRSHILLRTTQGPGVLLYQPATDQDVRGFHVKQHQSAARRPVTTWLLRAAGSAAEDVHLHWLTEINSKVGVQLLRLMNRTLEEETTIGFPGPLSEETGQVLMKELHADIESGRRHVLVAEKDGVIVGQLILTPNSVPNHRHMVELTRGTIDRSFRGGGLALRAFAEVARKCEELQREVICLDVRAGTMAAMWWQHFGFKPFGLLADYSRVRERRYKGLYLTQTTEDLKNRVQELAARDSRSGQGTGKPAKREHQNLAS
jgi:hypothetical protein